MSTRVRAPDTAPDAAADDDAGGASDLRSRLAGAARLTAPAILGYAAVRLIGVATLWVWASALGRDPLFQLSQRFDSGWYIGIVERGYDDTALVTQPDGSLLKSNLAFFPLYPALMRAVAAVLPVSYGTAGMLISWLAGLVAAAGLFAIGNRLYGRRVGIALAVIWGALPHAIVQSMAYTEPVLTAFAAWALYAVLTRRWLVAGALCVLAGLTRPTAVALITAVGVAAAYALWKRQDGWRPLAGAVLAPLGWLGYLAWVSHRLGSPTGWLDVQRQWGSTFDGGAYTLEYVGATLGQRSRPLPHFIVMMVLAIGVLLLVIARRQPLPLVVFSAAMLVLAIGTAGFYHSKARLLVPAFTLLVPVALGLARARPRTAAAVLVLLVAISSWFGPYLLMIMRYSP